MAIAESWMIWLFLGQGQQSDHLDLRIGDASSAATVFRSGMCIAGHQRKFSLRILNGDRRKWRCRLFLNCRSMVIDYSRQVFRWHSLVGEALGGVSDFQMNSSTFCLGGLVVVFAEIWEQKSAIIFNEAENWHSDISGCERTNGRFFTLFS